MGFHSLFFTVLSNQNLSWNSRNCFKIKIVSSKKQRFCIERIEYSFKVYYICIQETSLSLSEFVINILVKQLK